MEKKTNNPPPQPKQTNPIAGASVDSFQLQCL